jgi:hypothetical protein
MAPGLLIISIIMLKRLSPPVFLCLCLFLTNSLNAEPVTGAAVIREMNLARQNPDAYAAFLEDIRSHSDGHVFVLPGQTKVLAHEGFRAMDEAIHFLRSASPLQPLTLSPGLCAGAADHCAEQAKGDIGHGNPVHRINRYGTWAASWGENIAYGKKSARDIVIALIIDDGVAGRKHRENIFASKFNYAGAAYGTHARFGSVCSMDFAGAYFERGGGNSRLVAGNP